MDALPAPPLASLPLVNGQIFAFMTTQKNGDYYIDGDIAHGSVKLKKYSPTPVPTLPQTAFWAVSTNPSNSNEMVLSNMGNIGGYTFLQGGWDVNAWNQVQMNRNLNPSGQWLQSGQEGLLVLESLTANPNRPEGQKGQKINIYLGVAEEGGDYIVVLQPSVYRWNVATYLLTQTIDWTTTGNS